VRSLLLSMPDSCEHNTPTVAVRMRNRALGSLAGNLDPHHRVAIAALVPVQPAVRPTPDQFVRSHRAADGKLGPQPCQQRCSGRQSPTAPSPSRSRSSGAGRRYFGFVPLSTVEIATVVGIVIAYLAATEVTKRGFFRAQTPIPA
jgi:hypothetical protein